MNRHIGPSGKLAHAFIDSKLTPLMVLAAIAMGAFAVLVIPREEEPQIIVPMIDIFVRAPGMTAKEVEERVTKPMEKLLWEIPGVEYVYSTSSPGRSMAVVRYYVGQDETASILKTYNKMYANFDLIPPGVSTPLIKPRWIDDVPILALTLWSEHYDHYQLRRMAARLHDHIKQCPDTSEVHIIGGHRRQIRVTLDPARLAGFHVAPAAVVRMLQSANQQASAGSFSEDDHEFAVETGDFLRSREDVESVVVGVFHGKPVYVRDVARVTDGPEEPRDYVYIGHGAAAETHGDTPPRGIFPAVTLSVAKRKGKNAAIIARRAIAKLEEVKGDVIPSDVHVTITRNYGETATDKSNELLKHLAVAVVSVTLLIALALGWRESGVVLVAIPVTLALTLLVFYLYDYTLNRVTLFALIFSVGILVDDAIVVVENIVRHFRLRENRGRVFSDVAVEAVDEIGNPTILATCAVIAAIVPMAFVRGLMGPYMRPIPVGASAAMLFSLVIAFVISPWASLRLLRKEASHSGPAAEGEREGWLTRLYRAFMGPII
ncbi:MAG: efflux RND transporter permease subunit, partial [Armatimonadota bacterium]